MLYNPKWHKTDPMQLATLIAWLQTRDPCDRYDYKNCRHCLLARYFRDCGFAGVEVSRTHVKHDDGVLIFGSMQELPTYFDWIASDGTPTFGAALQRARLVVDA